MLVSLVFPVFVGCNRNNFVAQRGNAGRIGPGTKITFAKISDKAIVIFNEGNSSFFSIPAASFINQLPSDCRTKCSIRGSVWLTSRYSCKVGICR